MYQIYQHFLWVEKILLDTCKEIMVKIYISKKYW